jgi:hypothetical protein
MSDEEIDQNLKDAPAGSARKKSGNTEEVEVDSDQKLKAAPAPEKKAGKTKSEEGGGEEDQDDFEILLPGQLDKECMVLVQINPDDAAGLALEGVTGAVGRIETDEGGGKDCDTLV